MEIKTHCKIELIKDVEPGTVVEVIEWANELVIVTNKVTPENKSYFVVNPSTGHFMGLSEDTPVRTKPNATLLPDGPDLTSG